MLYDSLPSGRRLDKEKLLQKTHSPQKTTVTFACQPQIKLDAVTLLEDTLDGKMNLSILCHHLLYRWVAEKKAGRDLLQSEADKYTEFNIKLKSQARELAALREENNQLKATVSQLDAQLQQKEDERADTNEQKKVYQQKTLQLERADQALKEQHLLIPLPKEEQTLVEECLQYFIKDRNYQNTSELMRKFLVPILLEKMYYRNRKPFAEAYKKVYGH